MLARLHTRAVARRSFAFETTLASRTFAPWLRTLRRQGFRVHIAFFSLPTPDLAVARVAGRVRQGGHDVPEDTIRRRFEAGLLNFFTLFEPVAHSWQMFDNEGVAGPRLIAERKPASAPLVHDEPAWKHLEGWIP
jgi:predicted ABC-type ATPase